MASLAVKLEQFMEAFSRRYSGEFDKPTLQSGSLILELNARVRECVQQIARSVTAPGKVTEFAKELAAIEEASREIGLPLYEVMNRQHPARPTHKWVDADGNVVRHFTHAPSDQTFFDRRVVEYFGPDADPICYLPEGRYGNPLRPELRQDLTLVTLYPHEAADLMDVRELHHSLSLLIQTAGYLYVFPEGDHTPLCPEDIFQLQPLAFYVARVRAAGDVFRKWGENAQPSWEYTQMVLYFSEFLSAASRLTWDREKFQGPRDSVNTLIRAFYQGGCSGT